MGSKALRNPTGSISIFVWLYKGSHGSTITAPLSKGIIRGRRASPHRRPFVSFAKSCRLAYWRSSCSVISVGGLKGIFPVRLPARPFSGLIQNPAPLASPLPRNLLRCRSWHARGNRWMWSDGSKGGALRKFIPKPVRIILPLSKMN